MAATSMFTPNYNESLAPEKHSATHVEFHDMPGKQIDTTDTDYDTDAIESAGFDTAATNRLVRKIDWALLPLLALLYLLSFLDRTNIGNARLAGLEKTLHMKGLDYNIALAVFFPFYVAAEIPSNLMMKKWRPSRWIPLIMVVWAICTTLMGLVTNFGGLLAARCALGIAEGGLFPGVAYYITCWYKRNECGLRLAIFFSAATSAGAFGGLLARGISEMKGLGGKAGWAWIFILEGLLTLVVAVVAYFYMHDYPSTAKFLTPAEKVEITRRLEEDRSALADEFSMALAMQAFKDWKVYVHMLITIGVYAPLYSISLFLPTIIRNLGYSNNSAQLMSVPPYIVACFTCICGGYFADRFRTRGVFMIGFCLLSILGFSMLLKSHNLQVKYAGAFLAMAGIYPNVPQGVAWNGNNLGGSTKRGCAIAMHVGFGNLGGILAAFVFLPKDSPQFVKGNSILIGLQAMSAILCVFMTLYLRKENKRRDAIKLPSEYTRAEMEAERLNGDNASFFRYTV